MPATKQYSRIYFENYPSENTPLNATNLNKLDKGIDDMDNEIVTVKNNLTASDNLTFKFTKSGNQYGYKDLANNFVPFKTTHTDTYTYPSGSTGGTYDMGVNHQYRYVNAANVYNKGKADGVPNWTTARYITSDYASSEDTANLRELSIAIPSGYSKVLVCGMNYSRYGARTFNAPILSTGSIVSSFTSDNSQAYWIISKSSSASATFKVQFGSAGYVDGGGTSRIIAISLD